MVTTSPDTSDTLDAKIQMLQESILNLEECLEAQSAGALLDLNDISDYRTHGSITKAERWLRINRFEKIVRNLKEVYYIGKGDIMCRVLGRYWIFFSGQDGYVAQHLMANGYWELSCTELVASEVQPGMKVIDAGANVGYYSVLMGDKVGPDGFMYIFEPAPSLRTNLEKTLFLNGVHSRAKLVTAPLWDQADIEVNFSVPTDDTKNARVLEGGAKICDRVILQTASLDSVIPAGQSIDFMKIDVEGAEHHMWRGMRRVLAESPTVSIFLEFNAGRLQEPSLMLDEIEAAGFGLRFLNPIDGAISISKETLLSERFGEDWMLILKR